MTAIAFLLNPDTFRPLDTQQLYLEIERDPGLAREMARKGQLVISNGDWSLRSDGVERFINAVAINAQEAGDLGRRLRPLP